MYTAVGVDKQIDLLALRRAVQLELVLFMVQLNMFSNFTVRPVNHNVYFKVCKLTNLTPAHPKKILLIGFLST